MEMRLTSLTSVGRRPYRRPAVDAISSGFGIIAIVSVLIVLMGSLIFDIKSSYVEAIEGNTAQHIENRDVTIQSGIASDTEDGKYSQNGEYSKSVANARTRWAFRMVERHQPSWRGRQIPIQVPIGWRIPVPVLEWAPATSPMDLANENATGIHEPSNEVTHHVNRIPDSVQIRLPVQTTSISVLGDTWRQRTYEIASRKLTSEELGVLDHISNSNNELRPILSVQWEVGSSVSSGVSFATEATRTRTSESGLESTEIAGNIEFAESARTVGSVETTDLANSAGERVHSVATMAAQQEPFDADEFWNAVFLAGGTEPTAIPTLRKRLATIQSGLPAFMLNPSPQDADLLLAYLYQHCFVNGYERGATGLHNPLERQTFNCVSGSLLYYATARQLGWPVRILISTSHMRCVVRTTSGDRIIETTNVSSVARNESREAIRVTSPNGVIPPSNQTDEREVDALAALESVLFHNRALQFSESDESEYALSCSAAAVWLDPESKAARSNFLALLNNSAIQNAQNGNFAQAEQWMRTACELAPDHLILAENYQKLKQQILTNP